MSAEESLGELNFSMDFAPRPAIYVAAEGRNPQASITSGLLSHNPRTRSHDLCKRIEGRSKRQKKLPFAGSRVRRRPERGTPRPARRSQICSPRRRTPSARSPAAARPHEHAPHIAGVWLLPVRSLDHCQAARAGKRWAGSPRRPAPHASR